MDAQDLQEFEEHAHSLFSSMSMQVEELHTRAVHRWAINRAFIRNILVFLCLPA